MPTNVLKHSLPIFEGPPGDKAPDLKRLLLAQGELAQIHNGDETIRYIAIIEFPEGGVRGNHYHQKKKEWIYLMEGELRLVVENVVSNEREVLEMKAGDLVVIPTRTAHALLTVKPGRAIEFSNVPFDPADTHRYSLG